MESKSLYCATAIDVCTATKLLAAKISRKAFPMWGRPLVKLAGEVERNAVAANERGFYKGQKAITRDKYLWKAINALEELNTSVSAMMRTAYRAQRPEDAIITKDGIPLVGERALQAIEKESYNLGTLIADEKRLLSTARKATEDELKAGGIRPSTAI